MKEFSCRFDLANEKYLSVFLGVFAKIVKVIYFAQVITFPESTHGKVHPCKVDRYVEKNGNTQINFNDKE